MKKILCTTLLVMVFVISTGTVNAQMSGKQMMGGDQQQTYNPGRMGQQQGQSGTLMGPGMMGNSGMGMMGSGMMMGYGGMGMMGPGMMGNRGMGMMGGGMMGSPMMGFAAGMNNEQVSQYEKYMKETRPIRKKMLDMRFEYGEALWNPGTTLKDLQEKLMKMNQLQQEIQQKIPR